MQCAFCKEEMNEGASVCKVCGRSQPLSPEQRKKRWVIAITGISAFALIGILGWLITDSLERANAVDRVVQCARAQGDKTATEGFISFEFDEMSNGQGWRTGEQVVKLQHRCFY